MKYAIFFAFGLFISLQYIVPTVSSTAVAGVESAIQKRNAQIGELP
ncbi:hypothetical protein ACRCPS_18160 [Pseudomonas aeruginosa]